MKTAFVSAGLVLALILISSGTAEAAKKWKIDSPKEGSPLATTSSIDASGTGPKDSFGVLGFGHLSPEGIPVIENAMGIEASGKKSKWSALLMPPAKGWTPSPKDGSTVGLGLKADHFLVASDSFSAGTPDSLIKGFTVVKVANP